MKNSLFKRALILLSWVGCVYADSFYSSVGLGLPQWRTSTYSAGMGGSGLALNSYLALNAMNPAAQDLKGMSVVSVGVEMEIVTPTIENQTAATRQARPTGFFMALPLGKKPAFLLGFQPRTQSAFLAADEQPYDDGFLRRTLDAKGGIYNASIGLQYALYPHLAVGAVFDVYFGSFRELWKTDFDAPAYLDTKETLLSHFTGTGPRFGIYWQPVNYFSLGLTYAPPSALQSRTLITSGGGYNLDPLKQKAEYPEQFAAGLGVHLDKITLAFDWLQESWDKFKIDGKKFAQVGDAGRAAFGLQYLDSQDPLAAYGRRIAFRFGGSYSKLPFIDPLGHQVREVIFAFGFGFPFRKNAGRIDAACEIGQRLSDSAFPYSENLTRITISATTVERWFIHRR
ncbi:MAG: hypothetical protein ONB24_05365 [candidate division KSB1 bacterium]|nr:hypothetical protein [candidate division KSB1 bacterium]